MPQYSIKLCTYDPVIIDAFERLRKYRKQAAFSHEALKQFLSTEKGSQVLSLMEGKASELFPSTPPLAAEIHRVDASNERRDLTSHSSFVVQNESRTVLDGILK
jgi:hypothetical protein